MVFSEPGLNFGAGGQRDELCDYVFVNVALVGESIKHLGASTREADVSELCLPCNLSGKVEHSFEIFKAHLGEGEVPELV